MMSSNAPGSDPKDQQPYAPRVPGSDPWRAEQAKPSEAGLGQESWFTLTVSGADGEKTEQAIPREDVERVLDELRKGCLVQVAEGGYRAIPYSQIKEITLLYGKPR